MGLRAIFIFIANIIPTIMACAIFVLYSVSAKDDPVTGEKGVLTTYLALSLVPAQRFLVSSEFLVIQIAIIRSQVEVNSIDLLAKLFSCSKKIITTV